MNSSNEVASKHFVETVDEFLTCTHMQISLPPSWCKFEHFRLHPLEEGFELAYVHAFFMSNTFISNIRLKLAKNQANAKQQPEAELLLFEKYSHSPSKLSSKIIFVLWKTTKVAWWRLKLIFSLLLKHVKQNNLYRQLPK